MSKSVSWLIILAIAIIFGSLPVLGAEFCHDKALEAKPILTEGRIMPLSVHAEHVRKNLFPKKTCRDFSSTTIYCALSLKKRAEIEGTSSCKILLRVDHVDTRRLLGLDTKSDAIAPETIISRMQELIAEYHKLKDRGEEGGGFGADLSRLITSAQKFQAIEGGEDWKILGQDKRWVSVRDGGADTHTTILSSQSRLSELDSRNIGLELIYEKVKPFSLAIIVGLLGFLFSILSLRSASFMGVAMAAIVILVGLEVLGMVLRVMVSGRAPVTNMYETVMWAGFGGFLLSAILGFKWKDARIWACGFAGNSICLFMMNFASGMLDPTIQPLVPVLRDNFWLSTHVTSVTFSYGCFFLSWVVANYVMLRWIVSGPSKGLVDLTDKWNYMIRIAIQIGVVFLAAGVILGGVWADYSWGRFWGWDPKETWSLIALVIFVLILHGRYVGWFRGVVFTMLAALGFLFVLMAWFGVNYILASGLHSYGFSSGGTLFLMSIFVLQICLVGATLFISSRAPTRKVSRPRGA